MSVSLEHSVVLSCSLHRAALLAKALGTLNIETENQHAGVRAALASARQLMSDLSALLSQGVDHAEEDHD